MTAEPVRLIDWILVGSLQMLRQVVGCGHHCVIIDMNGQMEAPLRTPEECCNQAN